MCIIVRWYIDYLCQILWGKKKEQQVGNQIIGYLWIGLDFGKLIQPKKIYRVGLS